MTTTGRLFRIEACATIKGDDTTFGTYYMSRPVNIHTVVPIPHGDSSAGVTFKVKGLSVPLGNSYVGPWSMIPVFTPFSVTQPYLAAVGTPNGTPTSLNFDDDKVSLTWTSNVGIENTQRYSFMFLSGGGAADLVLTLPADVTPPPPP